MPVECWITPEETPALAASATAQIDAALARLTETERAAFWSSVRKCYNTPYNDPAPRALPPRLSTIPVTLEAVALEIAPFEIDLPAVAMAAIPAQGGFPADTHAA